MLGALGNPMRSTLTNAEYMANHLGEKLLAGSVSNVALEADGRDNSRTLRR